VLPQTRLYHPHREVRAVAQAVERRGLRGQRRLHGVLHAVPFRHPDRHQYPCRPFATAVAACRGMSGVLDSHLAVLPGTTPFSLSYRTDLLLPIVTPFLDAPMPAAK
jgi:hypothetical protein